MKINKSLSIILSLLFISVTVQAQFRVPKYKNVVLVKDRQPVVIVTVPDQDEINKYMKKGEPELAQKYQQDVGILNEEIKANMKKFWTFNTKEILFKTRSEVNNMLKDKSQRDKYILVLVSSTVAATSKDFMWSYSYKDNYIKTTGPYTVLSISTTFDDPIFGAVFPGLVPTASQVASEISIANYLLNYSFTHKDMGDISSVESENSTILSKKTLLINKSELSKKINGDVGKYYPCSYKVVSDSEMSSAVISGNPAYAYLYRVGVEYTGYYVVNCQDGAIIGFTEKDCNQITSAAMAGLRQDFFEYITMYCSGTKK